MIGRENIDVTMALYTDVYYNWIQHHVLSASRHGICCSRFFATTFFFQVYSTRVSPHFVLHYMLIICSDTAVCL
jgi:hypothetical protein